MDTNVSAGVVRLRLATSLRAGFCLWTCLLAGADLAAAAEPEVAEETQPEVTEGTELAEPEMGATEPIGVPEVEEGDTLESEDAAAPPVEPALEPIELAVPAQPDAMAQREPYVEAPSLGPVEDEPRDMFTVRAGGGGLLPTAGSGVLGAQFEFAYRYEANHFGIEVAPFSIVLDVWDGAGGFRIGAWRTRGIYVFQHTARNAVFIGSSWGLSVGAVGNDDDVWAGWGLDLGVAVGVQMMRHKKARMNVELDVEFPTYLYRNELGDGVWSPVASLKMGFSVASKKTLLERVETWLDRLVD